MDTDREESPDAQRRREWAQWLERKRSKVARYRRRMRVEELNVREEMTP